MQDLIINIEDKEFKAKFVNSNPNISINDNPYQVSLLKSLGKDSYSFSVNNRICQVEFDFHNPEESHIILDGMVFNVHITNDTKKMIDEFIKQAGGSTKAGAGMIKAPMPGLVIKILVEEGQEIQKGDKIIIIEAMKMENALQSPINGIVKKIYINEGQPVEKDAKLIEIEEN